MGCAQTSANVIPVNHIPIERIYTNEDYSFVQHPPVVFITAPPTPAYVKSALKKTTSDERRRTEKLPLFNRKPPSINKSVNFDEQVLVKARTPTPSKIWYEKASSTMPMRKHRRHNDDDDDNDDYDEEDIPSISSDEEQENNEQIHSESQKETLGHPTSLLQSNQTNTFWHNPHTSPFMPTTNTMLENESYSPSSYNMNGYGTESQFPTPINRIKVRRKLPELGPPQILPISSYQFPPQSSTISPYQSSIQPTTVPSYQLSPQTSLVSPYQSSVQPPPPALSSYQSPQSFYVQPPLPNSNLLLNEPRSTLSNNTALPQTTYYPFNRHPVENVT